MPCSDIKSENTVKSNVVAISGNLAKISSMLQTFICPQIFIVPFYYYKGYSDPAGSYIYRILRAGSLAMG